MSSLHALFDQVVDDCCASLVPPGASRRLAPSPVTGVRVGELVAVIGFAGDQVRGAVGLCAGTEALLATHPTARAGGVVAAADLDDWIAESANQLLGRLKAELHRYGVSLWMGTPIVLRGVAVSVLAGTDSVRRYALEIEGDATFSFWVDLEVFEGVELAEPPLRQGAGPKPGDLLLF